MNSHRKSRRAFVASRDSNGRVMVVRDTRTGKWMLPGGNVDHGESSRVGAHREFWEESGNHTASPLRRIEKRNGTSLFETRLHNGSHSDRVRRFQRRPHKHETSDYGFVDLNKPRLVVTNHRGQRKKANPDSFRFGTVPHLVSLSRHTRGRHNRQSSHNRGGYRHGQSSHNRGGRRH